MDPKRHFSFRNDASVGDIANLKGFSSEKVEDEAKDQDSVSFGDIQKVQMFKDTSLLASHVLRIDLGVFQELERILMLRQRIEQRQHPAAACINEGLGPLSRYISDTIVQGQRVDHLLKKIEGASTLVLIFLC